MRKKEKEARAKSMRTLPPLQCLKVQSRFIRQKVAFISKCLPVQSQILHSSLFFFIIIAAEIKHGGFLPAGIDQLIIPLY